MNDIKIIIVGAGKVSTSQLKEIISKTGHNESEIAIVENIEDFKQLTSFNNIEVKRRLEIEKIDTIAYLPKCNYDNECKRLSQQGWKNKPRYKR